MSENAVRQTIAHLCRKKKGIKTTALAGGRILFYIICYLFKALETSTAQETEAPTMGLLPIPIRPIISTWAGTDEEPANCASECIRPIVSVMP